MIAQPDWAQLAKQLIVAVQSTEHAYKKTRIARHLTGEQQRHVLALSAEKDRYILAARRVTESPASPSAIDWRFITLNLLRAHSITWELLWLQYESGVPLAIESGLNIEGRHSDADRYIDDAVRALAATEPQFNGVDWDGREILRRSGQRF